MRISIVLVAAAFLCLVAFPTTTVGKNPRLFWPKPTEGWPSPVEVSRFESFTSTSRKFNYGDSKVWKCTYSNGSAPAISISPSIPFTPSPVTPSPSPPTPKTSPPPPTPKKSPPPSSPSLPPPTPKKSPPPTPKKSPSPPPASPSPPPPAPKKSPSPAPSSPSLPPPTPKKPPSPPRPTPSLPPPSPPPPSGDVSSSPSQPFNPHPEHHHSHHHQSRWEHFGSCMSNMGPVGVCRGQMEFSFFTKMFQVSDYCCNLIVNMKNECDDVLWGYFNDPFFVPLVRCTCHVTY